MSVIHHRESSLVLRAGDKAYQHIREHGLKAADVDIMPGAAGGPKGIGILGLDRAIFADFLPRAPRQRTLIGSSIGSWRFAAVVSGGNDPTRQLANLKRLAELYTQQRFPKGIKPAEVSRRCQIMLADLLDGQQDKLLNNPAYKLVVLMSRGRHLLATDKPLGLLAGLLGVVTANLVSRRGLRFFFERTLASTVLDDLPLGPLADFPPQSVALTQANINDVLMASASIPMVLPGVRRIEGAKPGTYRDGGLVDYHLDLSYQPDGLVLYSHFTDRVTPGWFDKPWKWRNGSPAHLRSMLLVAPSPSYLANLPNGKLPNRSDFRLYEGDDTGRERDWRKAIAESERMGDELLELIETGKLADRLERF